MLREANIVFEFDQRNVIGIVRPTGIVGMYDGGHGFDDYSHAISIVGSHGNKQLFGLEIAYAMSCRQHPTTVNQRTATIMRLIVVLIGDGSAE